MVQARSALEFAQEAVEHADEALALHLETFDELRKSIREEQGQIAYAPSQVSGGFGYAPPTAIANRAQPARPEIRPPAVQSVLARRRHLRANRGMALCGQPLACATIKAGLGGDITSPEHWGCCLGH